MCPYLICALLIVGVGHLSLNRSFFIVCTVIHKYVRYLCMYYETIIWTRVGPKIQFKVFVVSRHLDIVRVLGLFVWAAHVRRMHKNTSTSACSVFINIPPFVRVRTCALFNATSTLTTSNSIRFGWLKNLKLLPC